MFEKATKEKAKARIALTGPPGSGKTFTALRVATALADGGPIALIDTERGSASKYADAFDFDVATLEKSHAPETYIKAIRAAAAAGYPVLIVDSLSHEWAGLGGALEMKDRITAESKSGNSYVAWGEVTPKHQRFIDAVLSFPGHLIATMRSKTAYVLETDDRGRQKPRKVGTAPVQREGVEYEFDVVGELDQDNTLRITKSRCPDLTNRSFEKPGADFADIVDAWVSDGATPAAEALIASLQGLVTETASLLDTAEAADAHRAIVEWIASHNDTMGGLKRRDKARIWEHLKAISESCGTTAEEMIAIAQSEQGPA
jgi:hypothetical protein